MNRSLPAFYCLGGQDPHGELLGQNVLIVRYSVELTAAQFGLDLERVTEILASSRTKLAEVRRARPPPHLDSKMLASWNGRGSRLWKNTRGLIFNDWPFTAHVPF